MDIGPGCTEIEPLRLPRPADDVQYNALHAMLMLMLMLMLMHPPYSVRCHPSLFICRSYRYDTSPPQ